MNLTLFPSLLQVQIKMSKLRMQLKSLTQMWSNKCSLTIIYKHKTSKGKTKRILKSKTKIALLRIWNRLLWLRMDYPRRIAIQSLVTLELVQQISPIAHLLWSFTKNKTAKQSHKLAVIKVTLMEKKFTDSPLEKQQYLVRTSKADSQLWSQCQETTSCKMMNLKI